MALKPAIMKKIDGALEDIATLRWLLSKPTATGQDANVVAFLEKATAALCEAREEASK